MQLEQNDEIDLFSLLKTIWDGKWKIIATTTISLFACLIYNFNTPNSFKIETTITSNSQDIFIKFKTLNEILLEQQQKNYDLLEINNFGESNVYLIDSNLIIEKFFYEFNDYKEMIRVLEKNEFVNDKIKNLNNSQKQKFLIELAKNFKVMRPNKKESYAKIFFNWHDVDEGIFLFKRALNITLSNVKNSILQDINNLVLALDSNNQRQINILKGKLSSIREIYNLRIAKRKLYLNENSIIAKELGILGNKTYPNRQSLDTLLASESNNIQDFPYYLRGHKAIDKEIELINNRSAQDKDLMSFGYIKIKEQLLQIEENYKSNELKNAAKLVESSNANEWIDYNFEFAKVKNLKKTKIYLAFSILIGLMIGVIYVFAAKTINETRK